MKITTAEDCLPTFWFDVVILNQRKSKSPYFINVYYILAISQSFKLTMLFNGNAVELANI